MEATLRIRTAHCGQKWHEITTLMQKQYERDFGTCPKGADTYIYITRGTNIIACFGLNEAGPDKRFAIERIYMLSRVHFPLPLDERNAFQFGRLVSRESGFGVLASHLVFRYARKRGALYGIVDHGPRMHDTTLNYGFSFRDLPYVGVCLEAVEPGDLPHYRKGEGRPYLVHIEESIEGTWKNLTKEHRSLIEATGW